MRRERLKEVLERVRRSRFRLPSLKLETLSCGLRVAISLTLKDGKVVARYNTDQLFLSSFLERLCSIVDSASWEELRAKVRRVEEVPASNHTEREVKRLFLSKLHELLK